MYAILCQDCGNTMSGSVLRCRRCKNTSLLHFASRNDKAFLEQRDLLATKGRLAPQHLALLSLSLLVTAFCLISCLILEYDQILKFLQTIS